MVGSHWLPPGAAAVRTLGGCPTRCRGGSANIVGADDHWESVFTDPFQGSRTCRPATTGPTSAARRSTTTRTCPPTGGHADLGHRQGSPGQAGRRGVRHQRCRRPRVPSRHRPNRRLRWADHRHASGGRHHRGVVVRRRRAHRHRRRLGQQEAGVDRRCFTQTRLRENVLLQAKGLPVRQRRARGQRARRSHGEHAGQKRVATPGYGSAIRRACRCRLEDCVATFVVTSEPGTRALRVRG